jgi:hypothetical protein
MNDLSVLSNEEQQLQEWIGSLDMSNPNAAALADIARDSAVPMLPHALATVEASLRRQAAVDILPSVADSTLSQAQIRSVFYGAMLARTKVLGFANFEILYGLLRTIRDERLPQIHPNNYTHIVDGEDRSFLRMAEEEAGISASVASDTMTLGEIILPYIEETLEVSRFEVWDSISTTNLRAMVPILRVMINEVVDTGDDRQPQERVQRRAEEVAMRWAADELDMLIEPDTEHLATLDQEAANEYLGTINENRNRVRHWLDQQRPERRVAGTVEWLLQHGEALDTRGFARLLGTREDNPFPAFVHRRGATRLVVAPMTEEQYENFQRVMRNRAELREVDSVNALMRLMEGRDAAE